MLKKTITYTDYDGETRTEDFYFNLSKAEIIKWVSETDGGYTIDKYLESIYNERNGKKIMAMFENLIYRSYGKKSLDGRRFIKTDEVKAEFVETEAYSVLFTELVTDAKKASDFFNSIVPKDIAAEIDRIIKENPEGIPDEMKDYLSDGASESVVTMNPS